MLVYGNRNRLIETRLFFFSCKRRKIEKGEKREEGRFVILDVIFSTLNHPCSFMVYHYLLLLVFFCLIKVKLTFSRSLRFKIIFYEARISQYADGIL